MLVASQGKGHAACVHVVCACDMAGVSRCTDASGRHCHHRFSTEGVTQALEAGAWGSEADEGQLKWVNRAGNEPNTDVLN